MMAEHSRTEGIVLTHVIGKNAGHHYTPEAKAEINRRIDRLSRRGRDPVPAEVQFTTWTLPLQPFILAAGRRTGAALGTSARGVTLRSSASPTGPVVNTQNVSALTLDVPVRPVALPNSSRPISRSRSTSRSSDAPPPLSDRSWTAHFRKVDGQWQQVVPSDEDGTAPQASWPARTDRRRLHGQLPDGPADGQTA